MPALKQLGTDELCSQCFIDLGLAPVGFRPIHQRLGLIIAAQDPRHGSLIEAELLRDVVLGREWAAFAIFTMA